MRLSNHLLINTFKSIKLPNRVDFGIERGDPNARLVYTCFDDLTKNAQADVTTVLLSAFADVEPSSTTTTCKSKQITVSFENPADKKKTQVTVVTGHRYSWELANYL